MIYQHLSFSDDGFDFGIYSKGNILWYCLANFSLNYLHLKEYICVNIDCNTFVYGLVILFLIFQE